MIHNSPREPTFESGNISDQKQFSILPEAYPWDWSNQTKNPVNSVACFYVRTQ